MSDHEWLIRRPQLGARSDSKEPVSLDAHSAIAFFAVNASFGQGGETPTEDEDMRLAAAGAYFAARWKVHVGASAR